METFPCLFLYSFRNTIVELTKPSTLFLCVHIVRLPLWNGRRAGKRLSGREGEEEAPKRQGTDDAKCIPLAQTDRGMRGVGSIVVGPHLVFRASAVTARARDSPRRLALILSGNSVQISFDPLLTFLRKKRSHTNVKQMSLTFLTVKYRAGRKSGP